jgi:hypothetical protein
MGNSRIVLSLLMVAFRLAFAQLSEDLKRKFDEAERRIVRLPPTAFPKLPRNVVRESTAAAANGALSMAYDARS